MVTLQNLLASTCSRLEKAGVETPRLDAEVLLSKSLGISRENFWRDSSRCLNPDEIMRCEEWVQRRLTREPLAYIIGEREFWSRSFQVTPDVLIPRPETEILLEQLLAGIPTENRSEPLRGLDMCTGSGVLAIIAALELTAARIVGVDISAAALRVADENSQRHSVDDRITWQRSDMFGSLEVRGGSSNQTAKIFPSKNKLSHRKVEGGAFEEGGIDFIVCNPPYIATDECRTLQPEISRFEPVGALDGGPNGLGFFEAIISGALTWLKPGGRLLMEIGCDQGLSVKALMLQSGKFSGVVLHQDYSGRDRVVSAQKRTDG